MVTALVVVVVTVVIAAMVAVARFISIMIVETELIMIDLFSRFMQVQSMMARMGTGIGTQL
jgi:hypothetical protein